MPSFKGEVERQEEGRPAKETQPEQQKGMKENQGVCTAQKPGEARFKVERKQQNQMLPRGQEK